MAETQSQLEISQARKKKDQRKPQDSFPARNGLSVAPGGRQQAPASPGMLDELMRAGIKLGPAALKGIMGLGGTPTQADIQGSNPEAFGQQRSGERGDFSSAMNGLGGPMPTQAYSGPQISAPAGADFMPTQALSSEVPLAPFGAEQMPSQMGDLASSGAGSVGTSGGDFSGLAGGLTGLIGPGIGYGTSLLTRGMDPVAGGLINAGAGLAGGIAGGAAAGAAGIGAGAAAGGGMAGAAAGAAAAGTSALVAAPIAAGMIMQAILEARDTGEAIRETKIRLRNIQSQMPGEVSQIRGIENIVNSLNENSSKEDLVGAMKQLNGIQHGYQEGGWESYQKAGGTVVGGGSAGKDISVALPGVKAQLDALNPYWGQLDTGRINAENTLMGREGMNAGEVEQATGRFINPIDVITSYSPETRAALFNAPPGTTAEQSANFNGMPSAGLMPGTSLMAPVPEGWTPGVQGTGYIDTPWGLANRQLYEELYGLQSSPNYKSDMSDLMQRYGTQLSPDFTAALPSGGMEVGSSGEAGKSVGRLQPRNVVTGTPSLPRPESDARTEAAFGMRRPLTSGNPASQDASQAPPPPVPGTSSAEPPAYGMSPGFPQAPGGNIGTGGLAVQSPFGLSSQQGNRGGM